MLNVIITGGVQIINQLIGSLSVLSVLIIRV